MLLWSIGRWNNIVGRSLLVVFVGDILFLGVVLLGVQLAFQNYLDTKKLTNLGNSVSDFYSTRRGLESEGTTRH
jgi:hypothetical protein